MCRLLISAEVSPFDELLVGHAENGGAPAQRRFTDSTSAPFELGQATLIAVGFESQLGVARCGEGDHGRKPRTRPCPGAGGRRAVERQWRSVCDMSLSATSPMIHACCRRITAERHALRQCARIRTQVT